MNPIESQLFGPNGATVSDQLFSTPASVDVSSQLFGSHTPSVSEQLFDDNSGIEEDELFDDNSGMEEDETLEADTQEYLGVVNVDLYGQLFDNPQEETVAVASDPSPTISVSEQLFGGKEYAESELRGVEGLDLVRLLSPLPSQSANITVNIGVVNIFNDGQ